MTILEIIHSPDPRLKKISQPVLEINDEIKDFIQDLIDTMYDAEGIGLAAVQVGVLKRILVLDIEQKEGEKNPRCFINPEIIEESEEISHYQEGCLSFPGMFSDVERPAEVTVSYMDEHGKQHKIKADGLLATCLQHEIDHLNGIVFVDHISAIKRNMILRKMQKAKRMKKKAS